MTPGTTPPNTPPSPEAQAAPKRRLGQRPRLFLACLGAAVGIAIILSACGNSTAGSTPSSAPTPTVAQSLTTPNGSSAVEEATSTPGAQSNGNFLPFAFLDNAKPLPNTQVTLNSELRDEDNKPVAGAVANSTWHFDTGDKKCDGVMTKEDGIASCSMDIGEARVGYEVGIDVTFTLNGQVVASTHTSFTPQK